MVNGPQNITTFQAYRLITPDMGQLLRNTILIFLIGLRNLVEVHRAQLPSEYRVVSEPAPFA